jgi:hypothetical protein
VASVDGGAGARREAPRGAPTRSAAAMADGRQRCAVPQRTRVQAYAAKHRAGRGASTGDIDVRSLSYYNTRHANAAGIGGST